MNGTIARVEITNDGKSGVIQYKNLNAEGGHSGSPLLLMQDIKKGNIVLDGESDRLIDKRILSDHGYATKLDERQYDIIGVHIEGSGIERTACLITIDKLEWINSMIKGLLTPTIHKAK